MRAVRHQEAAGSSVDPAVGQACICGCGGRGGHVGGERGPAGSVGGDEHRDRAAQRAHPHRQLADRIAVGIHRERAVRARSRPRRRGTRARDGSSHMSAAEDLRQVREEAQLADLLDHHDLEQAVVEHRVGRQAHPAAVGLRVGGRDRVAGEGATLAGRVELDLKARRAPGRKRAQRAIGIDEAAEPGGRFVGDPVGVAVEAGGGDADECLPLAETSPTIHRGAGTPCGDHRARRQRGPRGCRARAPGRCRGRREARRAPRRELRAERRPPRRSCRRR